MTTISVGRQEQRRLGESVHFEDVEELLSVRRVERKIADAGGLRLLLLDVGCVLGRNVGLDVLVLAVERLGVRFRRGQFLFVKLVVPRGGRAALLQSRLAVGVGDGRALALFAAASGRSFGRCRRGGRLSLSWLAGTCRAGHAERGLGDE
jgi:hypothetical protein